MTLKMRCKVLGRQLAVLALVFTGVWVLEKFVGESKVFGKGGELFLASILDHFLFNED